MKILFLDSPSYGKQDISDAFIELGFKVLPFYHDNLYAYNDSDFNIYFDTLIHTEKPELVFSFNFFPSVSTGCERNHLKYISFVYDSPQVALYSYTMIYSCNYIFLFDKTLYQQLKDIGLNTVYYLPLCVNTKRLASLPQLVTDSTAHFSSDVSFVGSLYTEDHNLFDRMTDLNDFTRGYLSSIMEAQLKVSGYYFIEQVLPSDVLAEMKRSAPYATQPDGTESDAYIYANYFIGRKLTSMERTRLLAAVSMRFSTKLYTINPTPFLPACENMGTVDYMNEMPHVFANSKINLNITLRTIYSGIPLRAFDIMGSGGFLLSNFQSDFLDLFVPGEDFDYYDEEDDLLNKIEYYLSHDKERQEIAANACHKVRTKHTYLHRVVYMLTTANCEIPKMPSLA